MRFTWFLLKRIASIIVTTCIIIALSYTLMHFAPGGLFVQQQVASAAGMLAAENPQAYRQMMHMWQERYGLNKPLYDQILGYIWHSFTLNFGTSFENPTTPIMMTLKEAFPISALLAVGSTLLATIIGIPLGIFAALRRNTWLDYTLSTVSVFGQAIPAYVFAVFMTLLFGIVWQNVLPINGWGTPADAVLPIICLAIGNIGGITRYMRGSMIDTMRQDFIRTARAKGVPERQIIMKHAFRNSLVALVTIIGPQLAFTVVGTVWVENIFSIPGLGTLLNTAFQNNDYPLAICFIFVLSMLVMVMNLLVDISYGLLDPRVKV